MQKDKIALQLYSVRDDMQQDFYGTLKKVKEMGSALSLPACTAMIRWK